VDYGDQVGCGKGVLLLCGMGCFAARLFRSRLGVLGLRLMSC